MSAPETLTISAGGLSFGALAWGDPAAPLALMLHGYPDTAWTWRHLGPHLAERGWRAVAPFTRGYGPSDIAPDDRYLVSRLTDDALALHAALGGDEHAVLIGHDWGAVTVWDLTARAPERFARYVALSVPPTPALLKPFTSRSTLGTGLRQAAMSWYFIYNQLPVEATLDRVIPKLWRDWSPGYDAREDVAHVLDALNTRPRRRAALRYYRDNLRRGIGSIFTIRAGAPALYLHGAQDGGVQAALSEQQPGLLAPGSRYERIDGVGHFPQLEAPARVNALIDEWIGDAPEARG